MGADSEQGMVDIQKLRKLADDILRQVVCDCGNYRHHGIDWMPEGSGEGLARALVLLRIAENAGFQAGVESVKDLELKYRKLLWKTHVNGTHARYLYGDDGEMQCNHFDCCTDFERAPLSQLEDKLFYLDAKLASLSLQGRKQEK